jgi:hypothetical protein
MPVNLFLSGYVVTRSAFLISIFFFIRGMATAAADVLNRMFAAAVEFQAHALAHRSTHDPAYLAFLNNDFALPPSKTTSSPAAMARSPTPPRLETQPATPPHTTGVTTTAPPPPRRPKRSREDLFVLKRARVRVNHSVQHDLRAIRRLDEVLAGTPSMHDKIQSHQ